MNSRCFSLGAALGLLLIASRGVAQSPRSLTEQDVVATAVRSNPSLHVALLQAEQSRYNLSAEEALYTPLFDANAGYTHGRSPSLSGPTGVVVTGSDVVDLGAGITKPFAYGTVLSATVAGQRSSRTTLEQARLLGANGPGYSLVGRLSAMQPLLRGAGSELGLASLRQAKLSLTANQLAARDAASSLLSQVVSAYWELWYSDEAVRINQASRELARVQQEQAKQQVASGALAPASALPYATQLAQLDEEVLAAQTDVRQRELGLAQLLGEPGGVGESLGAADSPEAPTADEPAESSAVNEALQNSYVRKQLQTELAILKDQLRIAGDPLRPRLDLDAYVQAQGLGNRSVPPAFEEFGRFDAVSAHVGLTFEMPITDTRRSAQIQAAQFAAHVAEKQLDSNELSIRSSVASAIAQRRAARQRLELSSQTEKVAHAQADAERARFLAGGSIAITVQQAEDAYRQAQLRVQRARVDLVLADLALAQVRGQLLTRYADAVKRLPAEQRVTLTNEAAGNF
ncbi:MAG TPA: TolC family protein [Polyangiaceae bacterium]|nr:TolC family protein [Polyangiaceae bacterium]